MILVNVDAHTICLHALRNHHPDLPGLDNQVWLGADGRAVAGNARFAGVGEDLVGAVPGGQRLASKLGPRGGGAVRIASVSLVKPRAPSGRGGLGRDVTMGRTQADCPEAVSEML